jgi:hypothetical protein
MRPFNVFCNERTVVRAVDGAQFAVERHVTSGTELRQPLGRDRKAGARFDQWSFVPDLAGVEIIRTLKNFILHAP